MAVNIVERTLCAGSAHCDHPGLDNRTGLLLIRSYLADDPSQLLAKIILIVCNFLPVFPDHRLKNRARKHRCNTNKAGLTLYPADVLFSRFGSIIRFLIIQHPQI